MIESFYLFVGYSDEIPKKVKNEEIILFSEGFENSDVEKIIPNEQLSYMTTFVFKTDEAINLAIEAIKNEWTEWTSQPINIELITDNYHQITRDQKNSVNELEQENFSFRLPFVAYKKNSSRAFKKAKKFIFECAKKHSWEFWK